MPFIDTGLPGLLVFEPKVFLDTRGYFFESYNYDTFRKQGITDPFVQDNQSNSVYGVIRGLHFQRAPYAQGKLVRALEGIILDVALDLRKGSPTYLKTFSIELSAENRKQLYVPKGFAHGFSVISAMATVLYKCNSFYNKESESGILYNDRELDIDWKIPRDKAIVSEKDAAWPALKNSHHNFDFQS